MNTPSPDPAKPGSGWSPAPTLPGGATSLPKTVGWSPDPKEPTAFGRYQLLRLLGRGGMGSVYLARDTQLDRSVAVKIPTLQGGSAELVERFYREARAAATLNHPNLCPVYDVGEVDGVPYLTMAFIEGQPLAHLIKDGQPMPPEQAARLVRAIALALQDAHEKGVVHRDLKPANIMITPKGEPVIMDFGLALKSLDTEEVRLTQTGMILGTLAYMSPEQVNGHRSIGPPSDVYSLGVVLYELLAGKIPFDGPPGQLMARTAFEVPAPPSQHRPGLAPVLDAICLKALAKRPEDRFATMADFARAVEAVYAPGGSPTVRTAPPRAPAVPRRRRGGSFWLIAAGVLLVLVGFFAGAGGPLLRWLGFHEAADRLEHGPLSFLSRLWDGEAKDTSPEQLFPRQVGAYGLITHDRKANCPEVGIRAAGWRADYAGPERFEVFVYHVTAAQKESMLKRARDKIGAANMRRDARDAMTVYVAGPRTARTMGVFYSDREFLIHIRGQQDPGLFLHAYLRALGRE